MNHILNQTSFFTAIDECVAIVKEVLVNKANLIQNKSAVKYTHRLCNQKLNILFCGGNGRGNAVKSVYHVDGTNLKAVKGLQPMIKERRLAKAVCLKGDVYVFGGKNSNYNLPILSIDKYSHSTNAWSIVSYMIDARKYFCVCAFMDKIFIIGGNIHRTIINSCLQLDTKDNNLKEFSRMDEAKTSAACTVFEGNVIVAGGMNNNKDFLKTVESYDVIANEWSPMPDMINGRVNHSLVVVKNKLYVIGSLVDGCEVYDTTCKKFVDLKSPLIENFFRVIAIGSKIIVFEYYKNSVICYDVDMKEWICEPCDVMKNMSGYSCAKVPWF